METKVYDQTWKESGSVKLNEKVFGLELNEGLVHRALVLQLANARVAIAHTKTRWERRGSTRKIFRQKGTGNARAGANRSPIRKGGWIVFGPRNNRNFTLGMNKKERQRALFCLLSAKVQNNALIVVKTLDMKEVKTQAMDAVMKSLPLGKTALIALASRNVNVEKSSANLKTIKTIHASYLNIADLLKYETLILPEDAVKQLNELAA